MRHYLLGVGFTVCFLIPGISSLARSVPTSYNIDDQLAALNYHPYCPIPPDTYSPVDYSQFVDSHRNQSHVDYTQLKYSSLFIDAEPAKPLPPLPSLNNEDAYLEAKKIQALLRKNVPHARIYTNKQSELWIKLAKNELKKSGTQLNRTQILIVVNRNPKIQALSLILAFPKNKGEWMVLGGEHVSTGQGGRKLYYITPTGVFKNTTDRIGYRALGTKNKLGIRGNGGKGMRVWDFGWQWAEKGWLPNHVKGQIRLEMHATDPVYLEPRLGRPASEGCVRISAAMNRFIDHYGLIDVLYNQAATYDKRFQAILSKKRQSTPLAGDLLVIVDSSENY